MGQNPIKLSDVAKFELYTHEGGLSNGYRKLEVVPDSGLWKCYQTDAKLPYRTKGIIDGPGRKLVKSVDTKILSRLLNIMAKPDTGINIAWFNITKADLVNSIDTNRIRLSADQKPKFYEALKSKKLIREAVYNDLTNPFMRDDRTYFSISVLTKTNHTVKIEAYSFAYIYDLPWEINSTKCYNPEISIIFANISGYNNYSVIENKMLYQRISSRIYYKYFKNKP